MCGIVGYIGREQAAPILLEGLSRLEYRGYDSAGVAVFDGQTGSLAVRKAKGRLQVLSDQLHGGADLDSTAGVGRSGKIAVVHNGIIENYAELKAFLMNQGASFTSETDTEVVAQHIEHFMFKEIMEQPEALRRCLSPRIREGEIVFEDFSLSKDFLKNMSRRPRCRCGAYF